MTTLDGILLLYHHPLRADAPTIEEHVGAWERHSRYPVFKLNTQLGFPRELGGMRFKAVVLHYSLFGSGRYMLDERFLAYLKGCGSYKVAFFQDEYYFCQARFAFIDDYKLDCVFTLLDPAYWDQVYLKYTKVPKLVHTLTGYVGQEMVALGNRLAKPDAERPIDIGYRARSLPYYMGAGAREKAGIADGVKPRALELGLKVDIDTTEANRIYGHHWYDFVASCKAMLGVEAGVSVFDLEDVVRPACEKLLAEKPDATFEEAYATILAPWEDRIFYRTLSPRHFEGAAFRTLQILFKGHYNGILQADTHYLALEKDFSNLEAVLARFQDPQERRRITDNAYQDLIASGKYTYQAFIEGFDSEVAASGIQPGMGAIEREAVWRKLHADRPQRAIPAYTKEYLRRSFPGRKLLVDHVKPWLVKHPALKRFLET